MEPRIQIENLLPYAGLEPGSLDQQAGAYPTAPRAQRRPSIQSVFDCSEVFACQKAIYFTSRGGGGGGGYFKRCNAI